MSLWRHAGACVLALTVVGLVTVSLGAQDPAQEIFGLITDRGGRAIPGATVTVRALDEAAPPQTQVTGRDGRFRVTGLRAGRYRTIVSLPSFKTVIHDGVVVSAGTPLEMNETIGVAGVCECVDIVGGRRPPPPGRLELKVTDFVGFDLPMAVVSMTGPTWNRTTGPGVATWGFPTDLKGVSVLAEAVPGEYAVTVAYPYFAQVTRRQIRVTSGKTTRVDFRLDALPSTGTRGEIAGRVLQWNGETGVGQVLVTVSGTGLFEPRQVLSDDTGTFQVFDLPPGVYDVGFHRGGFADLTRSSVVVGGERINLDVRLAPTG